MADYKFYIAEWITRLFLGILLFFQGFDKVFVVKIKGVIEAYENEVCARRHIPRGLLSFAAYWTSCIELLTGFLLILGLFKYFALTLIGIDLLLVAVAFSIVKPMWDMKFVFPRLVLLITLLLLPEQWNVISLDYLIQNLK
ncbi:MAG: DoxX family membrane protein [Bacteroidia bacterium]